MLEDSASSEPSAEALFLSTESIVQGKPFATEAHFPLLEDIEPSELFATEAHFPLLEDSAPSEPFATEAHFPLLEDIEPDRHGELHKQIFFYLGAAVNARKKPELTLAAT